jgi:hypothetical protein
MNENRTPHQCYACGSGTANKGWTCRACLAKGVLPLPAVKPVVAEPAKKRKPKARAIPLQRLLTNGPRCPLGRTATRVIRTAVTRVLRKRSL